MMLVGILLLLILSLWVFGFIFANDFKIPSKNIKKHFIDSKRVLVVFPHADDEVLSMGGLLSQLSAKGVEIYWVVLTKGEKGNENAIYDEGLKEIRVKEAKNASEIYGVKKLIQLDFPDNAVDEHKVELTNEVKQVMQDINPDVVLTYDLAGLYGHPDHIVVSEVVTKLVKEDFKETKLWYVSFPEKILNMTPLPEHMAKDPNYKSSRMYPTHRIWVGFSGVINKIKAVYTYNSQRQSYVGSFPVKFIPLWFYVSLTPYEYIHEVEVNNQ